jgi:metal-responsive CopG/Arc/MetJ family transcriptional regulator
MNFEKDKQIAVSIERELLLRVDNFRFEQRIPTRSEAIRALLRRALAAYEKNNGSTTLSGPDRNN